MHNIFMLYCVIFFILTINSQAKVISKIKSLVDAMNKGKHELLAMEDQIAVGSSIQLNANEKVANDILMSWKYKELDESFNNPNYFNFSKHYLVYREDIEKSTVYQIIKRMPKGAALHLHSPFILDIDYLMNFLRTEDLYICYYDINELADEFSSPNAEFNENDFKVLHSEKKPTLPCKHKWISFDRVVNKYNTDTKYYREFKQFFSLFNRNPETLIYEDSDNLWNKFDLVYNNMKSLTDYWLIHAMYIYRSLRRLYQDNVMYAELRTNLNSLYEADGFFTDREFVMDMYKNITENFKKNYPDFIGLKLIVTRDRKLTEHQVKNGLNLTRTLNEMYPGMIAGFDLVGQEDKGNPLSYFLPVLFEAKNDVNYYLHAGETNWNSKSIHENMFDAIVLGTKRIGHAYALLKHPSLIQAIIDKDIAIEANVISNNVFGLVKDMRNHPLATYLAAGLPVVLSSDYPGAWGAEPLSHDFFVTFMAIANKHADLRLLKQLALNSIQYSTLYDNERAKLLKVFNDRWDKFIHDLITKPENAMHSLSKNMHF